MDQMGENLGWGWGSLENWAGRQGQGGIVTTGKQRNGHRKAGQARSPQLSRNRPQEQGKP